MALQIRDWDKHFENAASRKLKRLDWVSVPNKTDGEGYLELVDHPNAAAHLGAWYAIVEAASKRNPRGTLPIGISHDLGGICHSLSRMSRLPEAVFLEAIPRLLVIGWLEVSGNQTVKDFMAESANIVGGFQVHREGNGREGKGTTGKGTEANGARSAGFVSDEIVSSFEDVWTRWPRKVGKDQAAREWITYISPENLLAAMSCVSRYLVSDEVKSGKVKSLGSTERSIGWLATASRDGWACEWPTTKTKEQLNAEKWSQV